MTSIVSALSCHVAWSYSQTGDTIIRYGYCMLREQNIRLDFLQINLWGASHWCFGIDESLGVASNK